MRKAALVAATAATGLAIGTPLALTDGQTAATPTHVVNVFLDGFRHYDFRQVCQQIDPKAVGKVDSCAGYFAFAQAVAGTQPYHVIPGTAKVWTEVYRGRTVRLASVQFQEGGTVLTAHLRFREGRWLIYAVIPV